MVEVHVWAGLRKLAGGSDVVSVEAKTVREMLAALVAAHPTLKPAIDAGVSVSIDGRIVTGGLNEPVGPENEIYLLQQLKGG